MADKQKARELVQSRDTFATTMLFLVIDEFGLEATEWTPRTLRMELVDLLAVEPERGNLEQLFAAVEILTTNSFYVRLDNFMRLCNVLSGDLTEPGVFNPATVAECAWGVTETAIIYPPSEDDVFSSEIRQYVESVMRYEGYLKRPSVLKMLVDHDFSDDVRAEFADDPEMFSAIHDVQAGKAEDIDMMVKHNVQLLSNQLQELDIKNLKAMNASTILNSLRENRDGDN